ncbi:MAG: hypothetical protein LBH98_03750 [Chitinispirillales bacterium]|jgi:hypothetical protein|nr:hypothetical protein [Chitinispirillales bacterium]
MLENKNTQINYDDIDVEIRELCQAINRIPHFETIESCFGHCAFGEGSKEDILIWIDVDDIVALNRFLCAFCHGYASISTYIGDDWVLEIYNNNTKQVDDLLHLLLRGRNILGIVDCEKLAKSINDYADEFLGT